VYVEASTVNVHNTVFSENRAEGPTASGDDIYNDGGTVTIHSTCPAGYEGSSATQGEGLDTDGTSGISGPLFSFTDFPCSVCPAGGYSDPGSDCVTCPAGTTLADDATSASFHDAVEDCDVCPAGT
jgi:hypothetical protein